MNESNGKGFLETVLGDRPIDEQTGRRRSALKAAWERLTPADEWASHRSFRLTPTHRPKSA